LTVGSTGAAESRGDSPDVLVFSSELISATLLSERLLSQETKNRKLGQLRGQENRAHCSESHWLRDFVKEVDPTKNKKGRFRRVGGVAPILEARELAVQVASFCNLILGSAGGTLCMLQ
jgi:hypothetical protein